MARRDRCRRLAIGIVAAVLAVPGGVAQGAADLPYGVSPTFRQSQADAGAAVYAAQCASCHGKSLSDGPFAPPLAGETFLQKWSGRRVSELVDYVATSMPPSTPGSLRRVDAIDLAALILQNNRVLAGAEPLPTADEALASMLLPAPTNPYGELAAGVVLPPPPAPRANPLDRYSPITAATLAHPPDGDWLTWRRSVDAGGFSPLAQIDRGNVARLQVAWAWALPNGENQATPLVHDGVMFVYGYGDMIQALDAASGDLLWQYSRTQARDTAYPKWRRGIAIFGSRVYTMTYDGYIVALHAKTGRTVWEFAPTSKHTQHFWFSGGPLIADGRLIFGTGGFHPGGNFVIALDAETGKEAWRFATIPEPGKPGGDSWNGVPHEQRSGGAVWTPGSYDPETNLVYFGVANTYDTKPLRDRVADPRYTNDALYTASTLALRADTGELAWYFQHFPNDQWDLDWAFERQITTLRIDGSDRKVVVTAGKIAIHDVLDARTGQYLFSLDPGLQNLVTAIDPTTGVKTIDRSLAPGNGRPTLVCPHVEGGKNWTPSSLDPRSNVVYVALIESCMEITPRPGGGGMLTTGVEFGLRPRPDSDGRYGRLEALDLTTRKSLWTARERAPLTSGVLATAGGLVFAGYLDRTFVAYDADTGSKLWSVRLDEVANSNAITYTVDGRQYLAVVVGMGGNHSRLFAGLAPEIRNPSNRSASVWVFALPDTGGIR